MIRKIRWILGPGIFLGKGGNLLFMKMINGDEKV